MKIHAFYIVSLFSVFTLTGFGCQLNNTGVVEGDDAMMGEDHMEDDSMMEDDAMMHSAGSYESYAPEKLVKANDGTVVLFFRASWCPTCQALDSSIQKNADEIPADVTILDVDYDSESELKKKYGVTYQHTLVQVDAEGNLIKKWSGGNDLESITDQIK